MVSRLQQKLPDKEKFIGKMTQAGQKMKEDNPFSEFFKKKVTNSKLIDVDASQKPNQTKSSRHHEGVVRVVYVDRMAAVLDRLDSEL